MHYYRWNRTGEVGGIAELRKAARLCYVEECKNPAAGRDDLCMTHHLRVKEHGNLEGRLCRCGKKAVRGTTLCPTHYQAEQMEQFAAGKIAGSLRHGYVVKRIGGVDVFQHRVVVERLLGRPLKPWETVHHKNGVRHDNRPDNLELWLRRHTPGQRLEDIVAWISEHYPEEVQERIRLSVP